MAEGSSSTKREARTLSLLLRLFVGLRCLGFWQVAGAREEASSGTCEEVLKAS